MSATRFLVGFVIIGLGLTALAAQNDGSEPVPFRGVTPGATLASALRDDDRWGEPVARSNDNNLALWEYRPRGYKKVVLAIHQGKVRAVDVFPADGLTAAQVVESLNLGELAPSEKLGPETSLGVTVPEGWYAQPTTAGRVLVFLQTVGDAEHVRLIRFYAGSDVERDADGKPAATPAVAEAPPDAAAIVTHVARILPQRHLSKRPLDAAIAQRWLELLVRELDPAKMYFTRGDIDEFEQRLDGQAERLRQGDIALAFDVFGRLLQRQDQRLRLGTELLERPFDFSGDDVYTFDPAKASYIENDLEARAVWRKKLMFDLLQQNAKNPGDDAGRARAARNLHQIRNRYRRMDGDEVLEMALSALARAFDPLSNYMSRRTWREFQENSRAQYEGIGAQLQERDGGVIVSRVIPGGAADKDGRLKDGDLIVGIGVGDSGKIIDIGDNRLKEIVQLIRGPSGTKVRLEVVPAGQAERIFYTLTREPIRTAKARGAVLHAGTQADPLKVGYLHLPSLYGAVSGTTGTPCSADVRRILAEGDDCFQAQGVELVVLDLRTNTGGLLNEAINIVDLFAPSKPVMQVRSSNGRVQHYAGQAKESAWDGPLVVLTGRNTASGAEIVVGALQSLGRALVVGETTHGVGTVQDLHEVGEDTKLADPKLGVVRVTTMAFYRPNGEGVQKRGVIPDVPFRWLTQPPGGGGDDDHAIDFDRIDALRYDRFNFGLNEELRARLRAQSAKRTEGSAVFQKIARRLDLLAQRNARGSVPLNLDKFRAERQALDDLGGDEARTRKLDDATEIERDSYLDEVLAICRDYWRHRGK